MVLNATFNNISVINIVAVSFIGAFASNKYSGYQMLLTFIVHPNIIASNIDIVLYHGF